MSLNLYRESMAEIRNANLSMTYVIHQYIKKRVNIEQAMIQITKELKRQGDHLKLLAKDGI